MTATTLISKLPAPQWHEKLIRDEQDVPDIVAEVIKAHQVFSKDYDLICQEFADGDVFQKIFDFCKSNMVYIVESEEDQTTNSPAVLLQKGYCDCKGYAGFVAGILDGLNRAGQGDYDWRYRFARYGKENHVFVIVKGPDGSEIWIDPVLSYLDQRTPSPDSWSDKTRPMTLVRMSGAGASMPSMPANMLSRKPLHPQGSGFVAGPLSAYGKVGTTPALGTWLNPDPPLNLNLPGPVPEGTVNGYGTATWIPDGYPTKTQPYLYNGRLILRPLIPITEVPLNTATPYIMAALQYGINTYSSTPYSILYSNLLGSAPFRIQMQTVLGQTNEGYWRAGAQQDDWLTLPQEPTGLDSFLHTASNAIPSVVAAGINAFVPGLGTQLLNALNGVRSGSGNSSASALVTSLLNRGLLISNPTTTVQPVQTTPVVPSVSSGSSLLTTIEQFAEANPLPTLAIVAAVALVLSKLLSD